MERSRYPGRRFPDGGRDASGAFDAGAGRTRPGEPVRPATTAVAGGLAGVGSTSARPASRAEPSAAASGSAGKPFDPTESGSLSPVFFGTLFPRGALGGGQPTKRPGRASPSPSASPAAPPPSPNEPARARHAWARALEDRLEAEIEARKQRVYEAAEAAERAREEAIEAQRRAEQAEAARRAAEVARRAEEALAERARLREEALAADAELARFRAERVQREAEARPDDGLVFFGSTPGQFRKIAGPADAGRRARRTGPFGR